VKSNIDYVLFYTTFARNLTGSYEKEHFDAAGRDADMQLYK
jgi:hypothetical protein